MALDSGQVVSALVGEMPAYWHSLRPSGSPEEDWNTRNHKATDRWYTSVSFHTLILSWKERDLLLMVS
jgi:hypothetical protein